MAVLYTGWALTPKGWAYYLCADESDRPAPPTSNECTAYSVAQGSLAYWDGATWQISVPMGQSGGGGGNPLDAYPVGALYLSVLSTSPATLLGGGTWSQIASGKMLVGQDANDTDFDVAGETGGAKTHTHAGHSNHVVTQPSAHGALSHAGGAVTRALAGLSIAAHAAHAFTQAAAHVFTQPAGHSNHAVTQPNAHSNHAFTQPNAHAGATPAIAWPAGVPTNAAHTHDAHTMTASGSSGATRASAPVTHSSIAPVISWPAGVPTNASHAHDAHAGGAVDAHSAHAGSAVDAHSAHSGGAVDAHSGAGVDAHSAHSITEPNAGTGHDHGFTQPSDHSSQTHAGAAVDAHSAHDAPSHLPPYFVVYAWQRTA